jgi:hypoxanthine-DNA glycosylase
MLLNSQGFNPIMGERPHILILGTMPGLASLDAQQYYAHPRNAFWPIMSELFAFDLALDYEERCLILKQKQVMVWDVLHTCYRLGSLDQDIDLNSLQCNTFESLFLNEPQLQNVWFNGQKAHQLFKRHIQLNLGDLVPHHLHVLPSTSPAHAVLSFQDKRKLWKKAYCDYLAQK